MDSDQWLRVKEIFNATYALEPGERTAYLDRVCKDEPELRREVEALLEGYDDTGEFLADSTSVILPKTVTEEEFIDTQIGHYHLKRIISTGGMGTVYGALQDHPQRTVAVKVLRQGVATKSTLRRFEYESEILARLTHPHIAQVIEAGTHRCDDNPHIAQVIESGTHGLDDDPSDAGIPYFVMEYVEEAKSITDYAREKALSMRERIRLFRQVCEAVHHGHQKGIIHRDLKPSNLLVNSAGQVKVIDFGIARVTDSDTMLTSVHTDVGMLIGTLQYMSPEQCRADPIELDVRSDVYSLGVLLYELLCGKLPYDVSRTSVVKATRIICENTPKRPSTINRSLRGDIETMVLKALEKDRALRYQSAADLDADLARYLNGEVILARPVGFATRSWKAVKRNPLVSGALAAGLLAIVASLCYVLFISLPQLRQERDTVKREKERALAAEQKAVDALEEATTQRQAALSAQDEAEREAFTTKVINDFLNDMLAAPNPYVDGREVKVVDVLDDAATRIESAFTDQPGVEAELRHTLGWTYHTLGQYEEAEKHLTIAVELSNHRLGEMHPDTLRRRNSLVHTIQRIGTFQETLDMATDLYGCQQEILGETHPATLNSLALQAGCHLNMGKYDEAESLYLKALDLQVETLGDEHDDTMDTRADLAFNYYKMGRFRDAEPLLAKVWDFRKKVFGEDHLETMNTLDVMCMNMSRLGQVHEAESLYRKLVENRRNALGEEHPDTIKALDGLALACYSTAKYDETEALLRIVVERARRVLGDDNQRTVIYMNNLVGILGNQGKLEEARGIAESLYAIQSARLGKDHPEILGIAHNLGLMLYEERKLEECEVHMRALLKDRFKVVGENHPHTLLSVKVLANALRDLEKYDEALPHYEHCLDYVRGGGKVRLSWEASVFADVGWFYMCQENYDQAKAVLSEGYEKYHKELGEDHRHILYIKRKLAEIPP